MTGKHSVVIPASLPAGEYLLRAEIVSPVFSTQGSGIPDVYRLTDCSSRRPELPWRSVRE